METEQDTCAACTGGRPPFAIYLMNRAFYSRCRCPSCGRLYVGDKRQRRAERIGHAVEHGIFTVLLLMIVLAVLAKASKTVVGIMVLGSIVTWLLLFLVISRIVWKCGTFEVKS